MNVWVYGFHAEADESAIAKEAVTVTAVISASPRGRRHDGGAPPRRWGWSFTEVSLVVGMGHRAARPCH